MIIAWLEGMSVLCVPVVYKCYKWEGLLFYERPPLSQHSQTTSPMRLHPLHILDHVPYLQIPFQ